MDKQCCLTAKNSKPQGGASCILYISTFFGTKRVNILGCCTNNFVDPMALKLVLNLANVYGDSLVINLLKTKNPMEHFI